MTENAHPQAFALSEPINVVLADDHQMVRTNLRLLLERERDVAVVAEAGKEFTTMRHVTDHEPHVLLLDLRTNGSNLELIRRLRAQVPETEIVVMTMEDSQAFAHAAIERGAVGYVLKENAWLRRIAGFGWHSSYRTRACA